MKLTIYMKSGNVIKLDKVEDWNFKYSGDEITSLSIKQSSKFWFKPKNKLLVESINLSQIECITRS